MRRPSCFGRWPSSVRFRHNSCVPSWGIEYEFRQRGVTTMKAIKVWALDRNGSASVTAVPTTPVEHTETERLLEDVLVSSPDLLTSGIELVGRQNQTIGGPLDLLGVDEDGVLVVFELKRGKLTREAVAQVIDYASYLHELSREQLAEHIETRSGTGGIPKIDDFESWYQELFGSDSERLQQRPRMVLVGLGVDDTTRRMVEFLSAGGLDMSLITFHAFAQNGQTFLARHVEIMSQEPPTTKVSGHSKEENLAALESATKELGCNPLFDKVKADLAASFDAYGWPSRSTFTFSLPERAESGNL